jgi:predicted metal-dependent phosphoesterase TrpH
LGIDLHLHSSVSDGVDPPAALMQLAVEAGMDAVALTDHDTLDGLHAAGAAAEALGLAFVPGLELSVDHHGTKMHMLVYFVEPGGAFEPHLADLREGRDHRNVRIIERLADLGYDVTLEDVQRHARGPSIGRPHIADALVERGRFGSRDEAFVALLHDGGPAYVERPRLTATGAIELAGREGAVAVIAHPRTIQVPPEGYCELFRSLTAAGLGGIEAYHPSHSKALRLCLATIANDLGIVATGGSDYHGEDRRPYRIGVGTGDLQVPIAALEALEARRAR